MKKYLLATGIALVLTACAGSPHAINKEFKSWDRLQKNGISIGAVKRSDYWSQYFERVSSMDPEWIKYYDGAYKGLLLEHASRMLVAAKEYESGIISLNEYNDLQRTYLTEMNLKSDALRHEEDLAKAAAPEHSNPAQQAIIQQLIQDSMKQPETKIIQQETLNCMPNGLGGMRCK